MLKRILSGKLSENDIERIRHAVGEPLPPRAQRIRDACLWWSGLSAGIGIASGALAHWTNLEIGTRWYALWCGAVALGYLVSFTAQIRHGQVSTFNRTGTVHRKTNPVSFTVCAVAAIALSGALTLTCTRALIGGHW